MNQDPPMLFVLPPYTMDSNDVATKRLVEFQDAWNDIISADGRSTGVEFEFFGKVYRNVIEYLTTLDGKVASDALQTAVEGLFHKMQEQILASDLDHGAFWPCVELLEVLFANVRKYNQPIPAKVEWYKTLFVTLFSQRAFKLDMEYIHLEFDKNAALVAVSVPNFTPAHRLGYTYSPYECTYTLHHGEGYSTFVDRFMDCPIKMPKMCMPIEEYRVARHILQGGNVSLKKYIDKHRPKEVPEEAWTKIHIKHIYDTPSPILTNQRDNGEHYMTTGKHSVGTLLFVHNPKEVAELQVLPKLYIRARRIVAGTFCGLVGELAHENSEKESPPIAQYVSSTFSFLLDDLGCGATENNAQRTLFGRYPDGFVVYGKDIPPSYLDE